MQTNNNDNVVLPTLPTTVTLPIKPMDERAQRVTAWLDEHYNWQTYSIHDGMLAAFTDDDLRALIEYELRIVLSLMGDIDKDADVENALEELIARSATGRFNGHGYVTEPDCGCLVGTSVLTAVTPPEDGWAAHVSHGDRIAERLAERARDAAGEYASRMMGMEILLLPRYPDNDLDDEEKRVMSLIREACETLLEELHQQQAAAAPAQANG